MVNHFAGQAAAIDAVAAFFADGQGAVAFPGNPHALMETFDAKGFAVFEVALAVTGDHFVQRQRVAVAVDVHQVALEALAAFMESDDQRIMAVLQHPQGAGDFQRRGEDLGWLRGIFRIKGVEHGSSISRQNTTTRKNRHFASM